MGGDNVRLQNKERKRKKNRKFGEKKMIKSKTRQKKAPPNSNRSSSREQYFPTLVSLCQLVPDLSMNFRTEPSARFVQWLLSHLGIKIFSMEKKKKKKRLFK